ncbi:MAG: APC family permease [Actinobacteria bacterium]|nr:APC family permease [Actinomycetota bacterium]
MTQQVDITSGPYEQGSKGLKGGALGLLSSVVIGVSSTAPGYSVAATLGGVVALVAFQAPAVMILAFIPMLFIAYAYRELNRVAPDCGTTFTWSTKAFGPWVGWMGGWGIIAADVVVMASLSQIAGIYGFLLFGLDDLANNTAAVALVGCIWIVLLTYVCYRGIEVSARFQFVMLAIEVVVLVLFSVIALGKVYSGNAGPNAATPELSWLNPLNIVGEDGGFSIATMSSAILLAVFIYWGWDSAVAVNEETKDPETTPGRAAILSTIILVLTYAIVAVAAVAFNGVDDLADSDDVLATLGSQVLGTGLDKVLIIAVLTSAAASTQTTILPTARTTLSMAAYQALPPAFAKVHPRFFTPTTSTIAMGAISIIFYITMASISDNILADSALAVGLLIAFYYGLTGFASAWYFRKDRGSGFRDMNARIIMPLLGGLLLLFAFIETLKDNANPENSATQISLFGWETGGVFIISVGALLLGVVLMLVSRLRSPAFFAGDVLNRDTEVRVFEAEPITEAEQLVPSLPDAPSQEQTVIPPLSVEELREAEAQARAEARGDDDDAESNDPEPPKPDMPGTEFWNR